MTRNKIAILFSLLVFLLGAPCPRPPGVARPPRPPRPFQQVDPAPAAGVEAPDHAAGVVVSRAHGAEVPELD